MKILRSTTMTWLLAAAVALSGAALVAGEAGAETKPKKTVKAETSTDSHSDIGQKLQFELRAVSDPEPSQPKLDEAAEPTAISGGSGRDVIRNTNARSVRR